MVKKNVVQNNFGSKKYLNFYKNCESKKNLHNVSVAGQRGCPKKKKKKKVPF